LRAQIEQSLAEYGSEQQGPQPEESLALLAAAAPESTESQPASEPVPASAEPVAAGNPRKNVILAALGGGLLLLTAILVLLFLK